MDFLQLIGEVGFPIAASLAAGIAGITPIGTSDISDNAVTVDKLAATLDLGALS